MQPKFSSSPAGAKAGADLIKDASTATFMADVIEASRQVPVIVDFWATWCGPCRQLGPILEKLVRNARGAVRLVKIDVDKNQQLAAQMRIQSIPAVYAFYQGQPVDGFMGALPESQVKAFIDRLIQMAGGAGGAGGVEELLAEAKVLLDQGDPAAASTLYNEVLANDPNNAAAYGGLARCLIAVGQHAQARALLDQAPKELANHAEISGARAALELAEQAGQAGSIPELMEKVAHNPDDHQARFDLAVALFAAGKREAAIDELLEIVRRDREWNEQAARKQLVKFFEVMGPTDKLTVMARRRLSSILFA